jgi:DNA-binding SARP family transcriptional activator
MEFRILGPLEVRGDAGAVALGGAKQRALLALLLLNANQVVSSDRLIDALWEEGPPATARKALQLYVSHLRKLLGRERLCTEAAGYVLRVGAEELDLARFERLRAQAVLALSAEDFAEASQLLAEAMRLWRGPALVDFRYHAFAQSDIARLDELRLAALEDRLRADLELGRQAELVGELEALVSHHPLRERLRQLLMLALYRAGRQAEALEAYRAARRTLVDELGIEPTRELQNLERAILAHDPLLDPTPRARPAVSLAIDDTDTGFVGRERELGELLTGLDRTFAGRGSLFLVAGEPGIGKTSLGEELARHARHRGATVLRGRCWEAGGAPAYWPWVQAIRGYVKANEPGRVRAQLGGGAADVAAIVPEVAEVLPDLPPAAAGEQEGGRFRLFDSIVSFLTRSAVERPVLLILDDLHAADEPSLLLLRFLAGELAHAPLLVVGAFRDVEVHRDHPLAPTLAELAREKVTRRVTLSGLSESEVGRYIELSTGVEAPELATAIHRQTDGNPLFLGEIVRLLESEGLVEVDGGVRWSAALIPEGVREAIDHRLRRLPTDCRRLLRVASVVGREFSLAPLERAAERSSVEALDLLSEAIAAQVVTELPGTPGHFRFSHALVRDSLYRDLGPADRARLHRAVGEALEKLYGCDLEPHLAELAHHFFEAGSGQGDDKALDYATRAGDRADAQAAYEEAARLYGLALELVSTARPGDDSERCELLLRLGEAQSKAGDMPAAREAFLRAAELARRLDAPNQLARAALGYGGRFVWARAAGDRRLVPLLREALRGLDEADSVLRSRLLARLAGALRDEPSADLRNRLSREAADVARRLGDPATLTWALDGRHLAIWSPDTVEERIALADEMLALAEESGNGEPELLAHDYRLYAFLELGDNAAVNAELEETVRLARAVKQPAYWWKVTAVEALLALLQGRFEGAERTIERALEFGRRSQSSAAVATHGLQMFALRREQGQLERVDQLVQRSAAANRNYPLWRCVTALLHCELGRNDDARALLDELATDHFAVLSRDEEWLLSMSLLADVSACVKDEARAGTLYEALLPYADRFAFGAPEFGCGSIARSLARLASTLGRRDRAETHFAAAVEANEEMGARPWAAHTRREWAEMLAEQGNAEDSNRGISLADEAMATYHELDTQAWVERTRVLKRTLSEAVAH